MIHRLLILGEAATAVSQEARELAPELPWREMMRMRDILIHHYFGVRLDVVWDVARDEPPGVVHDLEDLLARPHEQRRVGCSGQLQHVIALNVAPRGHARRETLLARAQSTFTRRESADTAPQQ